MKWEASKDPASGKPKRRGCLIAVAVVIVIAIVGSIARCVGGGEEDRLEWPTSGLATMLPTPDSERGTVVIDDADTFDANVEGWKKSDYDAYVEQCTEKGFTVDAVDDGDGYEAFTEDGYHLKLSYYDGLEEMSLRLEAPRELGPISWPTTGVGALLPAPESGTGEIAVDSSSQFTAYVGETDESAYSAYAEACMAAGFSVDYDRGDTHFNANDVSGNSLHLEFQGFDTMYISLYGAEQLEEGTSKSVEQEPVETQPESAPSEDPATNSDFRAMVDEYESFMNSYCDFMETYSSDSSNVLGMAADYAEMMDQYSDWVERINAVDESALSAEDSQYLLEAQTRINQRLIEIGMG